MGETPGIFATAVGVNGRRCAIIDMDSTNPEGWSEDRRPIIDSPSDMVVYELHYRDFSAHPQSGYNYKGKYLALTEPKALYYLTALGVRAVQLMPSFDFATIDEEHTDWSEYNWGYDPTSYNVLKGSFSSNPKDPYARMKEFKMLVTKLHENNIRVNLDLVFNHTYKFDDSIFNRLVPNYYYLFNSDNSLSNGSMCGNDLDSSRKMMKKYILDMIKRLVSIYHIDGVRLDLMGILTIDVVNQILKEGKKLNDSFILYGEGWNSFSSLKEQIRATLINADMLPDVGFFNDKFRNTAVGSLNNYNTEGKGFLNGNEDLLYKMGKVLRGSIEDYGYFKSNSKI